MDDEDNYALEFWGSDELPTPPTTGQTFPNGDANKYNEQTQRDDLEAFEEVANHSGEERIGECLEDTLEGNFTAQNLDESSIVLGMPESENDTSEENETRNVLGVPTDKAKDTEREFGTPILPPVLPNETPLQVNGYLEGNEHSDEREAVRPRNLSDETMWRGLKVEKGESDNAEELSTPKEAIPSLDQQLLLINELFDSEKNYVEYLELLVDVFVEPMEVLDDDWKRELAKHAEVVAAFMYLKQIRSLNQVFKDQLGVLVCSIENQMQAAQIEAVCQMVGTFSTIFRLYAQYAACYRVAAASLAQFEGEEVDFRNFLMKCKTKSQGVQLNSFMIMPIQRVPRYELFLSQILEYNEEPHLDSVLLDAVSRISTASKFLDDAVNGEEQRLEIVKVQQRIRKKKRNRRIDLISGQRQGRALIKQGFVIKGSKSGSKLELLEFFLFSDLLMYSEPSKKAVDGVRSSSQNGRAVRLRKVFVAGEFEIVDDANQTVFLNLQEEERDVEVSEWLASIPGVPTSSEVRFFLRTPLKVIELYAATPAEKESWVSAIKEVNQFAGRISFPTGSKLNLQETNPSTLETSPIDMMSARDLYSDDMYVSYLEREGEEKVALEKMQQVAPLEVIQLAGEILENEQKYTDDLATLVDAFIHPIQDFIAGGFLKNETKEEKSTLLHWRRQKMRRALADVEGLLSMHSLIQLEILHNGVSESLQEVQNENVLEQVVHLFKKLIPFLNVYASFIERKTKLLQVLSGPTMHDLVVSCEKDSAANGRKTDFFFTLPINRLGFYKSALSRLVSICPENQSSLDNLLASKDALIDQIMRVESAAKDKANHDNLLRIELSLQSQYMVSPVKSLQPVKRDIPRLVSSERVFLLEQELLKVCSGGKLAKCTFWLFNDMLVYASKAFWHKKNGKFRLHHTFSLAHCFAVSDTPAVTPASDASEETPAPPQYHRAAFRIRTTTTSFVVLAPTKEVMDRWVTKINTTASSHLGGVVLPQDSIFYAPALFPFTFVKECMVCKKPKSFGNLLRPLVHCQVCGRAVCKTCLSKMSLPSAERKLRACPLCCPVWQTAVNATSTPKELSPLESPNTFVRVDSDQEIQV